MNDLNTFMIRSAGEGIQATGDARTPFASDSTSIAHYGNKASSNCLVLGELSPGGEGIRTPFQALAKEQFGSPLFTDFSRMKISPVDIDSQQDSIDGKL